MKKLTVKDVKFDNQSGKLSDRIPDVQVSARVLLGSLCLRLNCHKKDTAQALSAGNFLSAAGHDSMAAAFEIAIAEILKEVQCQKEASR